MLEARHAALVADHAAGKVRMAFASRKLFQRQNALTSHGYAHHAAWKKDWQAARTNPFLLSAVKMKSPVVRAASHACSRTTACRCNCACRTAWRVTGCIWFSTVCVSRMAAQILAALESATVVRSTAPDGKPRRKFDGTAQ
jgi:hypothetical protein